MPWSIPRLASRAGEMKTGRAPAKMMADMTDLCTLRGTMILSPGEQTVKIIVMMAPLVPCTEKKV